MRRLRRGVGRIDRNETLGGCRVLADHPLGLFPMLGLSPHSVPPTKDKAKLAMREALQEDRSKLIHHPFTAVFLTDSTGQKGKRDLILGAIFSVIAGSWRK